MSKNRINPRAPAHRSSEQEDSEQEEAAKSGPAKIIDAVLNPEPACEHCVDAKAFTQNPEQLCEVHAAQSLPYESPLRPAPTRGPEQRRQDAWILN